MMVSLYYIFQRKRAELLFNKYIRKKTLKITIKHGKNKTEFADNENRMFDLRTKSSTVSDIFRKLKDAYSDSYKSINNVKMTGMLNVGRTVAIETAAKGSKAIYFTYKRESFCPSSASSSVIEHYANCEKLYDRLLWLHNEAASRPRPDIEDYYKNELVKVCDFNTFG